MKQLSPVVSGLERKDKMTTEYIPKAFPEKCVLVGGGQFLNQFIIVNVLSVKESPHPMSNKRDETVPQATVEERGYNGIKTFEPYLMSYHLYPLAKKYQSVPLDTYLAGGNGVAEGQYTKHILNMKG